MKNKINRKSVNHRFKALQLKLARHKCRYYIYDGDCPNNISDSIYDNLEHKYLAWAEKLGKKDRVGVGFPAVRNLVGVAPFLKIRPKTGLYRLAILQVQLERIEAIHKTGKFKDLRTRLF